MAKSDNPKRLIVEGQDDLYSVVGLMQHHIDWPSDRNASPVFIDIGHSVDEILAQDYITTLIKDPTISALGIMLDADEHAASRYSSFKHHCSRLFPKLPKDLPTQGLIIDNDDEKRIGLWVMPDNVSSGALEVFLQYLVPDASAAIWQHAVQSASDARDKGAQYRDCHRDKANLYTWLAWQDEPGQSPGRALTRKILDPSSPNAALFIKWFMELYSLQPSLPLHRMQTP
ncbi:MAG: hypothetical protein PHD76_13760 [Methylacidiphilales bacterium]|nr:hypothetical protein [Candidatus Methylacidiphilales bacterium]